MARTERQRRQAYDNVASGSATGFERLISDTVSPQGELYGGGKVTSTSTEIGGTDHGHSNLAAGASTSNDVIENVVGGSAGFAGENVG